MEAVIAFFLVLSTLTACAGGTMTDVKSAPPPPERSPVITYQAVLETHTNEACDEDGVLLAACSYEVPVLQALREDGTVIQEPQSPKEEEAVTVTEAFNEQFTDWTAEEDFQGLTAWAREDRAFRQENGADWIEYTASLSCGVYQRGDLISISAAYYSDTGGANPNSVLLSWNFDLGTGTFFDPEALAEDSREFSNMVSQAIISQAEEKEAQQAGLFWEDYWDIARDWSSYAVSFDETGMTVGYSPYEMAAYAAGEQVFFLSYEQLRPYLGAHGLALLGLE